MLLYQLALLTYYIHLSFLFFSLCTAHFLFLTASLKRLLSLLFYVCLLACFAFPSLLSMCIHPNTSITCFLLSLCLLPLFSFSPTFCLLLIFSFIFSFTHLSPLLHLCPSASVHFKHPSVPALLVYLLCLATFTCSTSLSIYLNNT